MSSIAGLKTQADTSFDRLTAFTFLWAVVRFFHLLSFPSWAYAPEWPSQLLLAAALLAMLMPHRTGTLVLLLSASLVRTWVNMPFVPNHFWFECIMDSGILLAVLWRTVRGPGGRTPQARQQLFETFAPMARIGVIVLYFYAVLHKLNTDYLTTPISCGTFLLDGLLAHLGIAARPAWANEVALWGTLVVESAVAALLVWRRTRRWAILLGMAFHFLLAVHPHPGLYSFTGLMFGYFYLFTPPAFTQWLAGWWRGPLRTVPARAALGLAAAVLGAAWLLVYRSEGFAPAAFVLWYAWCAVVFAAYVGYLLGVNAVEEPAAALFAVRFRPLWLFLLAVVFNGLTPYLGLKTQISFSMFSNLRTENDTTNHLFMPHALLTHRWQDDLVAIDRTTHPELARFTDGRRLLAHFELRRIVSRTTADFYVDYRRAGRRLHFERRGGRPSDAHLARPHPFLMDKFMRFRPVFTDSCRCQH